MVCESHIMPTRLIISAAVVGVLCSSCVTRPWRPTNVGHETGTESTPLLVSHLPKKNQWAMARSHPHNIFQQIICFNYVCRRLIGRNKLRQAITFEDYGKQLKKNAKKGVYKNLTPVVPATTTPPPKPPVKKQKKDTIVVAKDTTRNNEKIKPAPIVAAPPILKADSLITLSEFLFETNSYNLKEKHYSELDSLGKFLLRHPTLVVNIGGHTDNTGNERHNVVLSMHRAEAVAHYLINKGVSDDHLFFEGFGSSHPIRRNDTEAGRAKNRRVEILISNPKKK